jgi:hypothetical protein
MKHTHVHTHHSHGVLWVGVDGTLHDDGSEFAFNTANSASKKFGIHRNDGQRLLDRIKGELESASHIGTTDCDDPSHLQQHVAGAMIHDWEIDKFGKGIVWQHGDNPSITWRVDGWDGKPHHLKMQAKLDLHGDMVAMHIDKKGLFYFHDSDIGFEKPKDPAKLAKAVERDHHHMTWGKISAEEWAKEHHKTGCTLYHWTTVASLDNWTDPTHTGPGFTYLTQDGNPNQLNADIPDGNIRISVDASQLDPDKFDDQNQWPHNHLYKDAIPQGAVLEIKHVERPPVEYPQVLPVEELNPKALGEDEKRHNEVQFSGDTGWLA